MAVTASSAESMVLAGGLRLRRGSEAEKRYQSGARATVNDIHDHGLEIMDKMAELNLSMGDLTQARSHNLLIGFITDEKMAAGFALTGALETGVQSTKPARKNAVISLTTEKWKKVPAKQEAHGKNNFFIAGRDITVAELENAFKTLTKRADIGILAINGDIMEKLKRVIEKHEIRRAFPVIVPLPVDDDGYKALEDPGLQRPKTFGFLPVVDPEQLFHDVEHEFEHNLYHFHNVSHDNSKRGHHDHQGHH